MAIQPGDKFGRLTVIESAGRNKSGRQLYKCECTCGNYKTVLGYNLKAGNVSSCGCYRREWARAKVLTHGMRHEPIYAVWNMMRQRCDNPNTRNYNDYGGRGISYHSSFNTFEGFMESIPEGYAKGLELDRIDNDGNYEPGNLRWVPRRTQANNKRNNVRVEDPENGEVVTLAELARRYPKVSASRLQARIASGIRGKELIEPARVKMTNDQIREVKQMLWSLEPSDVSTLTGLSVEHLTRIRDRKLHDDVSEF